MEENTAREVPRLENEAFDEHRIEHYLGRYERLHDASEGVPDLSWKLEVPTPMELQARRKPKYNRIVRSLSSILQPWNWEPATISSSLSAPLTIENAMPSTCTRRKSRNWRSIVRIGGKIIDQQQRQWKNLKSATVRVARNFALRTELWPKMKLRIQMRKFLRDFLTFSFWFPYSPNRVAVFNQTGPTLNQIESNRY